MEFKDFFTNSESRFIENRLELRKGKTYTFITVNEDGRIRCLGKIKEHISTTKFTFPFNDHKAEASFILSDYLVKHLR